MIFFLKLWPQDYIQSLFSTLENKHQIVLWVNWQKPLWGVCYVMIFLAFKATEAKKYFSPMK